MLRLVHFIYLVHYSSALVPPVVKFFDIDGRAIVPKLFLQINAQISCHPPRPWTINCYPPTASKHNCHPFCFTSYSINPCRHSHFPRFPATYHYLPIWSSHPLFDT